MRLELQAGRNSGNAGAMVSTPIVIGCAPGLPAIGIFISKPAPGKSWLLQSAKRTDFRTTYRLRVGADSPEGFHNSGNGLRRMRFVS